MPVKVDASLYLAIDAAAQMMMQRKKNVGSLPRADLACHVWPIQFEQQQRTFRGSNLEEGLKGFENLLKWPPDPGNELFHF